MLHFWSKSLLKIVCFCLDTFLRSMASGGFLLDVQGVFVKTSSVLVTGRNALGGLMCSRCSGSGRFIVCTCELQTMHNIFWVCARVIVYTTPQRGRQNTTPSCVRNSDLSSVPLFWRPSSLNKALRTHKSRADLSASFSLHFLVPQTIQTVAVQV